MRYLSDNNLTKLEDSPFQNLSNLFELNLAHNNISYVSTVAFAGLVKLRSLSLQNNKLEVIPIAALEPLTSLEALHLDVNQLRVVSPESLQSLRRLQKLWLNGNQLNQIPSQALSRLPELEALDLGENKIQSVPDFSFQNLTKLVILMLYRNEISYIDPLAFNGLEALKVLEIHGNKLTVFPIAVSSLPTLRELIFSDNAISELSDSAFRSNPKLTLLEMGGNPITKVGDKTFAHLPALKKLRVSEARLMEVFPDLTGTTALELLTLDRASLQSVPLDLCEKVPLLRRIVLRSNKIDRLPDLQGCKELRQIDLSYNEISSLDGSPFLQQAKLIDLYLSYNFIQEIPEDAFCGLSNLQVLDLMHNEIEYIHENSFLNLTNLRDLNLGENKFPYLPSEGLQNLRQLKTFNNRNLREFPSPENFPQVHTLALSYAYHCCVFRPLARRLPLPATLKETVVWLTREDVDMNVWSTNITDVWPGYENFSSKFEEFASQLWKSFGRDYTIPENLAQFAEEYFRDYKVSQGPDSSGHDKQPVQCLPEPGPFMPCEDLFGWWSLRCGVWVVFLLAMLGNGVVVVVLLFGRSKVDVPRFLVCNLAMADFFMGIYLGILAVVDASTLGEFRVYAIQWQMSAGCQIAGFLGVLSSELSVYTLAVITLERNYAITHAMHLNKRLSLKHASYIMGAGWTFALLMALLPLLGISDYRKFAVCLPFETEDPWSMSYVVFLILVNGVAFLTLMGCYLKMYWVIRGSQAWNSNDSRIAKRMALLVITDFICWAPIAFFSLTAVFGVDLISLEEAKVFTIFVLPLNSCANPFLYAIFTKQFKKDCVLICKRIEESRVTRGIGRCRHSSNFSNRHTPANTNSAGERKSGGLTVPEGQPVCQCGAHLRAVDLKYTTGTSVQMSEARWKSLARRYLRFQFGRRQPMLPNEYAAASGPQRRMPPSQKRASSISSDNYSSRSDSWRQGNLPLRLLERGTRRNSWTGSTQKSSQDSSNSCSRQDSSTSTFRLSRSSVSSDASSSRPGCSSIKERAALNASNFRKPVAGINGEVVPHFVRGATFSNLKDKPRLCRQGAVSDDGSKHPVYRGGPTETAIMRKGVVPLNVPPPMKKGVCATCGRRETLPSLRFKSKELEDKFNCFYNRLVETSHEESSEANTSKDDHMLSSSTDDRHKTDSGKETADTSLSEQPSEDLDSSVGPPPPPLKPPATLRVENTRPGTTPQTSSAAQRSKPHKPRGSPKVHVSSDNITKSKSRSMSNLGLDLRLFSRQRKAASDNSLKQISLKNLPHFLRSLSSQSTETQGKTPILFKSRSGQQLSATYYPADSGPIPYCRSDSTIVGPDVLPWGRLDDGLPGDRSRQRLTPEREPTPYCQSDSTIVAQDILSWRRTDDNSHSDQSRQERTPERKRMSFYQSDTAITSDAFQWGSLNRINDPDRDEFLSSGADDADIDDEEELKIVEKSKVLVRRKGESRVKEEQPVGSQQPLCVTNSTASEDTPLIDREVKPAS
ncbi:leucine-rich repeat-containing G-protein coupled receptor 5-like [Uloborus diversus]|uniref:leucine-rich repeat-containing G-protein coupled receptor 5-like n=1 Tax=Uloborus diversus TaxID=327109 RepID=UPI0024098B4E|nr:leucine-rich repeat-containing G-protein coupled receptor 5-like [Uloborus diversus]